MAAVLFGLSNLAVVAFFIGLSVYLYNKLTYKNIHIKWVKVFIEGFGGKKLTKAMQFMNEISEYKMEKEFDVE